MRDGKLLIEKNPEILIKENDAISLEEVVLQLCRRDTAASSTEGDSYDGSHSSEFYDFLNYSFQRLDQGKYSKAVVAGLEDLSE
jgi:hypothetical protein